MRGRQVRTASLYFPRKPIDEFLHCLSALPRGSKLSRLSGKRWKVCDAACNRLGNRLWILVPVDNASGSALGHLIAKPGPGWHDYRAARKSSLDKDARSSLPIWDSFVGQEDNVALGK